jgi:3-deoxy-7-phosphoheptulonate synthase
VSLLENLPAERVTSPHPLVDTAGRVVDISGIPIGEGAPPALIAGPCAVESAAQIDQAARLAAAGGARLLRGGAYKPRTSPYSFQGVGARGLGWMRRAADRHGLAMVTEALTDKELPAVAELADMIQVGSRTMHAYGLLKEIGKTGKPVLLKRGFSATIEEWLLAAEYLLQAGAAGVVLCERGIRTFETQTRNTLDLCAVAHLLEHHRLPVIVDPSHAAGRPELVARLSRASLAAGAHGLMIEIHPDPERALSDGDQALTPERYLALGQELVG